MNSSRNGKSVSISRHGRPKTVSGKILRMKSCFGFQSHQKIDLFCFSYYQRGSPDGRPWGIWPGTTVEYWWRTKTLKPNQFNFTF